MWFSLNEGWRFARYGLQAEGTRLEEPEGLFKVEVDDADWNSYPCRMTLRLKGLSVWIWQVIPGVYRFKVSDGIGRRLRWIKQIRGSVLYRF